MMCDSPALQGFWGADYFLISSRRKVSWNFKRKELPLFETSNRENGCPVQLEDGIFVIVFSILGFTVMPFANWLPWKSSQQYYLQVGTPSKHSWARPRQATQKAAEAGRSVTELGERSASEHSYGSIQKRPVYSILTSQLWYMMVSWGSKHRVSSIRTNMQVSGSYLWSHSFFFPSKDTSLALDHFFFLAFLSAHGVQRSACCPLLGIWNMVRSPKKSEKRPGEALNRLKPWDTGTTGGAWWCLAPHPLQDFFQSIGKVFWRSLLRRLSGFAGSVAQICGAGSTEPQEIALWHGSTN